MGAEGANCEQCGTDIPLSAAPPPPVAVTVDTADRFSMSHPALGGGMC